MKGSISHSNPVLRRMLNWLFIRSAGGSERPPILQTEQIFLEGLVFENRFDEVKREIDELLTKRELTRYQEIDPQRAAEVSNDWKLYYVYFLGKENLSAKIDCPVILDIVKRIPTAISATIAVLEPRIELAPHEGPYAGILRYHLGIRIPKHNPPSIRVLNEHYTWKLGESIVIDDVYEHEVINKSEEIRVILMVDFMRPMNFLCHAINKMCLGMKRRWGTYIIDKAVKP